MFHYVRFKNFFSFRCETELSFRLNRHVPEDRRSFTSPTGQRLTKLLAVIGPNASGKTNALKPLAFLKWFVTDSFFAKPDASLAFQTHFFSDDPASEFLLEFEINGKVYRYELVATREKVIFEAVYVKTSRLFSYLFRREWQAENNEYQVQQKQFGFNPYEARQVRPNASLICTAAQFKVPLALDIVRFFRSLYTNVDFMGRRHFSYGDVFKAADFFADHEYAVGQMTELLRKWDLGLA
nr:AAA family ATPase [Pseudomonadota bacterium]